MKKIFIFFLSIHFFRVDSSSYVVFSSKTVIIALLVIKFARRCTGCYNIQKEKEAMLVAI